MKPLKLEFQAFGPYVEKQTVDFEKLSTKGMFLITGDTGSGKTTIFDAMTFALYGGGSGTDEKAKNGRNDINEWRCTQAPDNIPTYVSFTFSTHGRKYVFARKLEKKRINFADSYECREIMDDGNEIPLFSNPKQTLMNEKAAELTGLTKEQFRQVVLLPQGQFEKFLTADSGTKESILRKIFGTEMWGKYADAFYSAALEKKTGLEKLKTETDSILLSEGCKTPDELKEKIDNIVVSLSENEQKHKDYMRDEKKKRLEEMKKLLSAYEEARNTEKEYENLLLKEEDINKKREKLVRADKAEPLREIIASIDALSSELEARVKNYEEINSQIPEAEKYQKEAEERKVSHTENSPVKSIQAKIGECESKRKLYQSIDTLKDALTDAENAKNNTEKECSAQDKKVKEIIEKLAGAKEELDMAEGKVSSYRDAYFAGIYGEIAGELEEGKKCPVCGSIVHPSPALKKDGSISKADLETAEKEAEEKRDRFKKTDKERTEAESKLSELKNILNDKTTVYVSVHSQYSSSKENLIEGIESETALDEMISDLNKQTEEYALKQKEIEAECSAAAEKLASLNSSIRAALQEKENADKKHKEQVKALDSALKTVGYVNKEEAEKDMLAAADRNRLSDEIKEYDAHKQLLSKTLNEKKSALPDKAEPDADAISELESELEKELSEYESVKASLSGQKDRLGNLYSKNAPLFKKYTAEIQQAQSDYSFAVKLRGDNGVGIERYVLAIMFGQVIGEANRMLSKVHGGRYTLLRTDEKGSAKKSGLELKVHDSWAPASEGRSVAMLSGGEKFLVSLALSIGLSTIAQRTGVQTEALFIDEGFGTLDEKSIQDAMDVLESVRAGHGMIGIISHVQLLEDNIPTHLEVIKKSKGSEIQMK